MKKMSKAVLMLICMVFLSVQAYAQANATWNVPKVKQFISKWPAIPQKIAGEVMAKYGAPNEVTASMLVWHKNGPWKRTILYKEEVPHDFPKSHTDLLQQYLDYKAPLDKYDDLAEYDGSVVLERTNGEISARCDKEAMNFLTLNLAHDVATGKKSVAEARTYYAKAAMEFMQGKKDPYTQGLKFSAGPKTKDPDMPAKM